MKKIFAATFLILVCHSINFAQCDKKVVITSSKTEYLDADSSVQRSEDEYTTIEISKPSITITPGDHTMKGLIKSDLCNWKIPYIEGSSVMEITMNDDQGNERKATMTIEGKNGKLTIWVKTEGMPIIIRVPIDKFEEKN